MTEVTTSVQPGTSLEVTTGSRAGLYALAGVVFALGVAALCVLAAVAVYWPLGALVSSAADMEVDLGPVPVGVTADETGTAVVVPGLCGLPQVQSVQVSTASGGEVWRIDAVGAPASAAALGRIRVGDVPPGFTEVVPLAAPLDPAGVYTVDVASLAGPEGTVLPFGATATFTPGELAPETVQLGDAQLAAADASAAPCESAPSS